jgi:transposase
MSHANAALTPRQRLRVARLVIDHGWPVSRAAEQFNCSWPTAKRWAERYAAMGEAAWQRLGRSRSARSWPCQPPRSTRSLSGAG